MLYKYYFKERKTIINKLVMYLQYMVQVLTISTKCYIHSNGNLKI